MHSVGADEDISLYLPPVREARGYALAAVLETGAAGTEVDDRGVELCGQELLQLGSVDQDERGAPSAVS